MAMAGKERALPHAEKDERAVTYRVRPGVARVYVAAGLLMCAAAVAVLALRPANFGKSYFNVLFYLAAVAIAVLSLLRFKTCRLTLSDDELYFYNGIIDVRRIPLASIERIDFNPEIRIRIHMRSQGRRTVMHRLPNVFSKEDTEEILGRLQREHGIEVRYIEKPGTGSDPEEGLEAAPESCSGAEEGTNG